MSLSKFLVAVAFCAIFTSNLPPVLAQNSSQLAPYFVMRQASKISPILGLTTSEKDLVGYFGARNVKRQTVTQAEGETADGTIIYPDDASRRVTFIWNDVKKREVAEVIRIDDQPSLWRLPNEITTGTKLTELEKLNGKSFKLAGFDWDYGGNVLSWNGGKLESALKSKSGKANATISVGAPKGQHTPADLSGDREFQSNNESMQKLNPVVQIITIQAP